jgi:hypothetical protein
VASLSAAAPAPAQKMLALLESKRAHARGYHRGVQLGNESLAALFEARAEDLLAQLASSGYVVPGRPGESVLLAKSVRFGGPMFGVFTEDELQVIEEWIAALPVQQRALLGEAKAVSLLSAQPPLSAQLPLAAQPPHTAQPRRHEQPQRGERDPLRPSFWRGPDFPALYHQLLTEPGSERSHTLAQLHLERLFSRASRRLDPRAPTSGPELERWVSSELQRETQAEPPERPIEAHLTREETLWLLTQLAPAALVDGAWLQRAPELAQHPAWSLMLRIYRDELGSGLTHQHHGNLFRRTLAAQGLDLPHCEALHQDPRLIREAFSTPALWLAYSECAEERLPELLGLNLATEMAGIGRIYSRAIALLSRHQIDPYFFELHTTIDNGATGHTAWSVQAIAALPDDPDTWNRLWLGYATYALSSTPLVRALARRFGPRLLLRRLRGH